MQEFVLEASSVSAKVMREQVMCLESDYPPFEYGNYRLGGLCRKLFDSATCRRSCATLSGSSTESPSDVNMCDPHISQGTKDSTVSDAVPLKGEIGLNTLGNEDVKISVNDDLKFSDNPSDMLVGVKASDLPRVINDPDYICRKDYRRSNKRKSGYRSSLGSKYACRRYDKFYDPRDHQYTPFRN